MAEFREALEEFSRRFKNLILSREMVTGIPVYHIGKESLPEIALYLIHHPNLAGTLSMEWAADLRPMKESYRIYTLFSLMKKGFWMILTLDISGKERLYPSITPRIHGAKWYEREIRDMFGLIADGHPDLRRLVRHEHWPKGTHPLKKDFTWNTTLEQKDGTYLYRHIEGEGVFEVPVGPIHVGGRGADHAVGNPSLLEASGH
ncbi:MAG: NADH-quinone oxidoreductase subunit C [Nitrospirae bacterium]|nr:NADH-quinone oxidoreductase subunit C [Nitrospirota bacterium]